MRDRAATTMLAAGATAAVRLGPLGILAGLSIIMAVLGWLMIKYTCVAFYWMCRVMLYELPRWTVRGMRWARYNASHEADEGIRWARHTRALLRRRAAR